MLTRRTLFGAAAGLLAAPAVRAESAKVLRFVPYVDLAILDPVANTAAQTRNHAVLVWDSLYGLDANYAARPVMVAGHQMDQDGRRWTLTLRQNLMFHDGTPVLARDAVASIRRWAQRDGFGATLMATTDELSTPDDHTIVFRLKKPFPLLPDALGKISPNLLPIMPERLAKLPADKPVPEIIGSGPFRMKMDERVPGSLIVYERFDKYAPAEGPPEFTSGAKIVHFDRVEWRTMPEPATAAAALRSGEVDWLEAPPPDLLPLLRQDKGLTVRTIDQNGVVPILRFNCLQPPFDNPAIRRAVLSAVQQKEFMTAFSDDRENAQTGFVCFCPHTPFASEAGLHEHIGNASIDAARKAVAAAGYKGEKTVVMEPTDHPVNSVMAQVGADLLKKLGFNVDDQSMDAGTMFQRRGNRGPVDKGGWSIFPSAVGGIDVLNPAVSFLVRGDGKDAWYGWPTDAKLESLRTAWYDAPDRAAQMALCEQMQLQILSEAPYLPLGQILQPTAYRNELTGILPGFAKFWNVKRG